MDTTIISAIIGALCSIATCMIGIRFGQNSGTSTVNVYRKQLELLYTPIIQMFEYDEFKIDKCRKIIRDNLSIVPVDLVHEIHSCNGELLKIKHIVYSNYNWTRKRLSYPYEKNKIDKNHIPVAQRNQVILIMIVLIVSFVYLLSTFMTVFSFQEEFKYSNSPLMPFFYIVFLSGTIFSYIILRRKKKD